MPTILVSSTEALTSCTQEKNASAVQNYEKERKGRRRDEGLTWMCVSLVATTSSIAGQTLMMEPERMKDLPKRRPMGHQGELAV